MLIAHSRGQLSGWGSATDRRTRLSLSLPGMFFSVSIARQVFFERLTHKLNNPSFPSPFADGDCRVYLVGDWVDAATGDQVRIWPAAAAAAWGDRGLPSKLLPMFRRRSVSACCCN